MTFGRVSCAPILVPERLPAANPVREKAREQALPGFWGFHRTTCASDLKSDHRQGKEHKRLDEHQAEDHGGPNGAGSPGVAGHAFARRRRYPSLAQAATECGCAHAYGYGETEQALRGA